MWYNGRQNTGGEQGMAKKRGKVVAKEFAQSVRLAMGKISLRMGDVPKPTREEDLYISILLRLLASAVMDLSKSRVSQFERHLLEEVYNQLLREAQKKGLP
jgi:hypothetical protein